VSYLAIKLSENLFCSNLLEVLVLLCGRSCKSDSFGSVPLCSVKCELSFGGPRDKIGGSSDIAA